MKLLAAVKRSALVKETIKGSIRHNTTLINDYFPSLYAGFPMPRDPRYYQALQTLWLWQTRTMERARRAELRLYAMRRVEGTTSVKAELLSAAYRCFLKSLEMTKKILDHIPTLQYEGINLNLKEE